MKITRIVGRIYEEYFEVPKEGKLREKVFITRIAMGIVFMCIWLGMMGFSAYAYFSSSVTSGTNTIVSATYSLDVEAPEGVIKNNDTYVLENTSAQNQTFNFTVKKAGDASVGYCKVITKDEMSTQEIYTTPIGKYKGSDGREIDVPSMPIEIIVAPGKTVTVEFVANWGSYSGDDAVASVVLNYGLSEEELQQIQTINDVVDETTDNVITDTTTEDSLGENVIEVPESEEAVEETENR